jgi:aminoglycoside phosphotransferase (APT) family kinase protein
VKWVHVASSQVKRGAVHDQEERPATESVPGPSTGSDDGLARIMTPANDPNGLGLNEQEITTRLEPWLQARLDDSVRVRAAEVPDNGASNLTCLLEVAHGRSTETLVLRTLSLGADQLYETYDLSKQYRIMEQLSITNVKVPRLLDYEGDSTVLGREFFVMYHTGGRSIPERPSYHQSGWFSELNDEDQRAVWLEGIDVIAAIHALDWQTLGLGFVALDELGTDHNERWMRRHSSHLEWMERRNGRSYPRLRRAFDWLESHFPVDTATSFLWADAKLGNVMVEQSKIVGVLDWEHSTIGPSLYDLANWMIFDRLMSDGAGVPRLPSLPHRDDTIRHYEHATGQLAAHIEYFELFSAVRLANVVCGMAPELIASGFVPESFADDNAGTRIMETQLAAMGLDL